MYLYDQGQVVPRASGDFVSSQCSYRFEMS